MICRRGAVSAVAPFRRWVAVTTTTTTETTATAKTITRTYCRRTSHHRIASGSALVAAAPPLASHNNNNNNNNNFDITRRCISSNVLRDAYVKPPSSNPGGSEILANLAKKYPHMDAVRFHHKNQKLTFHRLEANANALATGFIEPGLQPGDAVLSWLPLHFAEHVLLQFACARSGLILYWLDPAMALTDPDKARLALSNALHLSKATVFITQEAGNDFNYVRLAERVIPETRIFCHSEGMPFVTPRFPHLRFPIQTGFESRYKEGFHVMKHMMVPAEGILETMLHPFTIDGNSPLMGRFQLDEHDVPVETEEPLTHNEVFDNREWPIYAGILRREYQEVPGVGVIW